MQKVFFIIFISVASIDVHPQSKMIQLQIGDICPDFTLNKIVNYKENNARIGDFKNKLLILDFWATWCQPCIAQFPKINALNKKFDGKVQIMPITYEEEVMVKKFVDKMERNSGIDIPSVVNDIVLREAFKHTEIPHYVWIDPSGKVVAITGTEDLTETNINKILQGQSLNIQKKIDAYEEGFNPDAKAFVIMNPLKKQGSISLQEVKNENVVIKSVLTKFLEGKPSVMHFDARRVACINTSIESMYRVAAGRFRPDLVYMNRSMWETRDTLLNELKDATLEKVADRGVKTAMAKKNWYTYELEIPETMDPDAKYDFMLADLNRYFGIKYGIVGTLEKRKIKCLVLIRTSFDDKLIKTKTDNSESNTNTYSFSMRNRPIDNFISSLKQFMQLSPPLIDGTNFKGNVDIEINCKLIENLPCINKELERYGLKFVEEFREIEMIVIKDKNW